SCWWVSPTGPIGTVSTYPAHATATTTPVRRREPTRHPHHPTTTDARLAARRSRPLRRAQRRRRNHAPLSRDPEPRRQRCPGHEVLRTTPGTRLGAVGAGGNPDRRVHRLHRTVG